MDRNMEKGYKGLVIAHNPLSGQTNNGKTYASLLSNFSKEQLCQIYVTNLEPDFEIAGSFYKISEKLVIRNKRDIVGGEVFAGDLVTPETEHAPKDVGSMNKLKKFIQSFTYTRAGQAARSWLWGNRSLLNGDLRNWIEKEKPDFVFWGNGNIIAMLNLVLQICREYSLPLIVNMGDDYFSRGYTANLFYNYYQKKLKSSFSQIAELAEVIIVCGDKMEERLKKRFGGNYIVAMNSVDKNDMFEAKEINKNSIGMVYTGNVGIGRWKTLVRVGQALNKLQGEWNIRLDVYSGEELPPGVVTSLNQQTCMKLHSAVYGEELHKIRENADIMLFVETFEKKHKKLLETAVSTKVPEYLNTKRAILAVGPEYSAAIDYYKRNDVAEVVSSTTRIVEAIRNLLDCDEKRAERIERGYALVEKEHLREVNAGKVEEYIVKGIEKKKNG